MQKIELEILNLTHSITQSHSYAVVLSEVGGMRRLPIVIGGFEAQSIAVALEKVNPSRPLTHDLIKSLCESFHIEIQEIIINNLEEGIFYSQLICKRGNELIEIDSRTSDALAIAVRLNCPIYTYEFIMDSAGLVWEDPNGDKQENKVTQSQEKKDEPIEIEVKSNTGKQTIQQLYQMLQEFLDKEDYEKAIEIRDEISRRKSES